MREREGFSFGLTELSVERGPGRNRDIVYGGAWILEEQPEGTLYSADGKGFVSCRSLAIKVWSMAVHKVDELYSGLYPDPPGGAQPGVLVACVRKGKG